MAKVSEVSASSQQIGRQLSTVLLAQGLKQAEVERRISGLAHQEQLNVDRAREITPPGTLRDEQDALIEALQFRVSGLNGLANALAATAQTKDVTRAGSVLASQMQRLLASDVVYDDEFKDPSSAELKQQGVTGTNESGGPLVPDSDFLQTADFATTTSMVNVLSKIRGGAVTPSQGGLRGTNIVKVKVLPAGTELSTTTQTTIIVPHEPRLRGRLEDSGDSQETSIPVTLTIPQSRAATSLKKTIYFINPGQQTAVTFTNIPAPNFGTPTTVKVEVQPVPGESNTDNNSADYPVIFSA